MVYLRRWHGMVPHETAAVSAQVLCTSYNHAPCHFMQSHICKVHVCLAVTCHLHFWQNDRDLLRATVVTQGGGMDTKSAQKVDPQEENYLHFWQNDRDFLRATAVTRGWKGYRNKSLHRKSTLEKKILPPFQQGFEPATFQSRVRCSNHYY